MNTHLPGFQSFFVFFASFCIGKISDQQHKGQIIYWFRSEKKRKPAWCDRILWMVHEDAFDGVLLQADQLLYSSLPQYKISDHKPVVAEFIIKVKMTYFASFLTM